MFGFGRFMQYLNRNRLRGTRVGVVIREPNGSRTPAEATVINALQSQGATTISANTGLLEFLRRGTADIAFPADADFLLVGHLVTEQWEGVESSGDLVFRTGNFVDFRLDFQVRNGSRIVTAGAPLYRKGATARKTLSFRPDKAYNWLAERIVKAVPRVVA